MNTPKRFHGFIACTALLALGTGAALADDAANAPAAPAADATTAAPADASPADATTPPADTDSTASSAPATSGQLAFRPDSFTDSLSGTTRYFIRYGLIGSDGKISKTKVLLNTTTLGTHTAEYRATQLSQRLNQLAKQNSQIFTHLYLDAQKNTAEYSVIASGPEDPLITVDTAMASINHIPDMEAVVTWVMDKINGLSMGKTRAFVPISDMKNPDDILKLANGYRQDGEDALSPQDGSAPDYATAQQRFHQSLVLDPGNGITYMDLADAYYKSGQTDQATQTLHNAQAHVTDATDLAGIQTALSKLSRAH